MARRRTTGKSGSKKSGGAAAGGKRSTGKRKAATRKAGAGARTAKTASRKRATKPSPARKKKTAGRARRKSATQKTTTRKSTARKTTTRKTATRKTVRKSATRTATTRKSASGSGAKAQATRRTRQGIAGHPGGSAASRPAPRRPAAQRTSTGVRASRARSTKSRRDPRQAAARPVARTKPTPKPRTDDGAALLDRLNDLIARAKRAGADAADAVTFESAALSQAVRLGEPETLERSESRDLGLRVFLGRRQAVVSSADFSAEALAELVDRAMAMVRVVPEDKFSGLADPDAIATRVPDLDLYDPREPSPEILTTRALQCEQTARDVPGINNSLGADASWGRTRVALVASNGFAGSFASSYHSVSVAVVAGDGTGMERDHASSTALHGAGLEDPKIVGQRAADRTLRRLNPRKISSGTMPVVFDKRVAGGLISHLASAANGSAIARGTSFLKDAMGTIVLPASLSLIDDPMRRRGLASMPFDGEGIATRRLAIVDRGKLASWVLDLATARQLGLATTGHARRGTSGTPSPSTSNLYLDGGTGSVDELIADIDRGILVTDLMGFGVNLVTGDYSRGTAGFLIENGRIAYPVSEITIAGNLKEMLPRLRAAGDLEFRHGTNAPTVRIDGMAVGGS
jgi:PmbA protein